MTPEERNRMNSLCIGIQEETDYKKFVAMLHEMSELIARKERRRFQVPVQFYSKITQIWDDDAKVAHPPEENFTVPKGRLRV